MRIQPIRRAQRRIPAQRQPTGIRQAFRYRRGNQSLSRYPMESNRCTRSLRRIANAKRNAGLTLGRYRLGTQTLYRHLEQDEEKRQGLAGCAAIRRARPSCAKPTSNRPRKATSTSSHATATPMRIYAPNSFASSRRPATSPGNAFFRTYGQADRRSSKKNSRRMSLPLAGEQPRGCPSPLPMELESHYAKATQGGAGGGAKVVQQVVPQPAAAYCNDSLSLKHSKGVTSKTAVFPELEESAKYTPEDSNL